jgi:hypothetical protein
MSGDATAIQGRWISSEGAVMHKFMRLLTAGSLAVAAVCSSTSAAQAEPSSHIKCNEWGGFTGVVSDMRVVARDCYYVQGAASIPVQNMGQRDIKNGRLDIPAKMSMPTSWDCPTLRVRKADPGFWFVVGFHCRGRS